MDCDKTSRFLAIKTREELAEFLEIKDASLRYFLYCDKEDLYRSFQIPKRNGKFRSISAPCKNLRNVQQKLLDVLNEIYIAKICVYGFVRGRNITQNAEKHTNRRYILNIDLKDFFTQIHFGRVVGALTSKPICLKHDVAVMVAQLACFRSVLPQGAPTSPILTNIVCRTLDNQLLTFARHNYCTYTRYADDITFSSNRMSRNVVELSDKEVSLSTGLYEIIQRNGFIVNDEKVKLSYRHSHQEVTGLTVNEKVNVNRIYIRNLRAVISNCISKGVYNTACEYIKKGHCKNHEICELAKEENDKNKDQIKHWFKMVIKGKLQFVQQIRGESDLLFLSLAEKANLAFDDLLFDTSYLDNFRMRVESNIFVIEPQGEGNQGTIFYLKNFGLITSHHVIERGESFVISRCSAGGKKEVLLKIMHDCKQMFADKNIDYVVYDYNAYEGIPYEIGNSNKLEIGDSVTTIGYPIYFDGNSANIQKCEITSKVKYHGGPMYTIKGVIAHGYSGGIVLNENDEIVGVIKGGVENQEDAEKNDKQGFVPIHVILDSIQKQKKETTAASE